MAKLAQAVKYPDENCEIFTFDFSALLGAEETFAYKDITVSAIKVSDGKSATSDVVDVYDKQGNTVVVKAKSGVEGEAYDIVCKITTSKSNVYKEKGRAWVRSESRQYFD